MKTLNFPAIIEALKELARYIFFGAIALLIMWVQSHVTSWGISDIEVAIITLALRGIDKWVHENEDIDLNGIVPF